MTGRNNKANLLLTQCVQAEILAFVSQPYLFKICKSPLRNLFKLRLFKRLARLNRFITVTIHAELYNVHDFMKIINVNFYFYFIRAN